MVSFKSPADTPKMPGMLRKSTAFVPRYQKFESTSLQQRVNKLSVPLAIFGDSRKQSSRPRWKKLVGPGRDFFEVFANAPI